jgi:hypothetical protein
MWGAATKMGLASEVVGLANIAAKHHAVGKSNCTISYD